MTTLAELLKKNDSTKHHGEALETVTDIAKVVGEASGYYETAEKIGAALGLWDGPTDQFALLAEQIDALRKSILKSFDDLAALTNEQFEILSAQHLDEQVGRSRTVIAEIAAQRANPNRLDVQLLLYEARGAVTTIQGGSYWTTPVHEVTTYRDEWSGVVTRPAEPMGADWNYMLALPVYLESLVSWITAIRLLDPEDFPLKHAADFEDHAKFLAPVLSTIVAGFHQLAPPTIGEAKPSAQSTRAFPPQAFYTNAAWMYSKDPGMPKTAIIGAADPWTTTASIEISPRPPWAPGEFGHLGASWAGAGERALASWSAEFDAWFEEEVTLRHAIRTSRNLKEIYRLSGAGNAIAVLSGLRQLAGHEPIYRLGRDSAWSLREIVDDLPPDRRPPYSVRALAGLFNLPTPSLRAVTDVSAGSSNAWSARDRGNHPEWDV